jgi:hypothetical protein
MFRHDRGRASVRKAIQAKHLFIPARSPGVAIYDHVISRRAALFRKAWLLPALAASLQTPAILNPNRKQIEIKMKNIALENLRKAHFAVFAL